MSESTRFQHSETPFPVGVEYYRAPIPSPDVWDGDFAWLSAARFKIVRSFSFWNHIEPQTGAPVVVEEIRVVPVVRRSARGGRLLFLFNLERAEARVTLRLHEHATRATDLLTAAELPVDEGAFRATIAPWEVAVMHCV